MEPDEGRNAEVAREMKDSGAWLVPTLNGSSYLDKPSFFFKASALAQRVAGSTPGAARFPSALSALLTLVCLFAFCRPRYGERTAALAVLIAGTSPLFFVFGRLVIMDATLALFVSAAIFAAVHAEDCAGGRRRAWYLASAACVGIATVVEGADRLSCSRAWWWRASSSPTAGGAPCGAVSQPLHILVFLAVTLGWFIPLVRAQPDFLRYGLVEESFHRFTTPQFKRSAPFWYYLPVLLGGVFAWSVLLPGGALRAWQARKRWSSTDRLFVAWTVVSVLFFTLSNSKRPGYVLTVVLALGALTARLLARAWDDPAGDAARAVRRGALGRRRGLRSARRRIVVPGVERQGGAPGRVRNLGAPGRSRFPGAGGDRALGGPRPVAAFAARAGLGAGAGSRGPPRSRLARRPRLCRAPLGRRLAQALAAQGRRRRCHRLPRVLSRRPVLHARPTAHRWSMPTARRTSSRATGCSYLLSARQGLGARGDARDAAAAAGLPRGSRPRCVARRAAPRRRVPGERQSYASGDEGTCQAGLGWEIATAPGGWQLACSPPRAEAPEAVCGICGVIRGLCRRP
jgi:hypothetical protein